MKKKRHRTIDPAKARARATCSRCGTHPAMIGAVDGECLRCRLEKRKANRGSAA